MAAIVASATALACGSDNNTLLPTTVTFSTTMNGAGENPAKNVAGVGTATIVKSAGTYTYHDQLLRYDRSAHRRAHPRAGDGGRRTPTSSSRSARRARATSGTLTGTFTSTNTATISNDSLDVLMRTGNAYVNLHTAANPGGEIRGQLLQQP